jgi:hypothetical protein
LAASQLVSNAVRHAGTPDDAITMTADLDGERVRVVIGQTTSASEAAIVAPHDRESDGGFGLAIVDDITDRWGADAGPPGSVWFEIRRP